MERWLVEQWGGDGDSSEYCNDGSGDNGGEKMIGGDGDGDGTW